MPRVLAIVGLLAFISLLITFVILRSGKKDATRKEVNVMKERVAIAEATMSELRNHAFEHRMLGDPTFPNIVLDEILDYEKQRSQTTKRLERM